MEVGSVREHLPSVRKTLGPNQSPIQWVPKDFLSEIS